MTTLAIDTVLGRNYALAQLQPDKTLGREGSVVQPINRLNDRIDGGAARGSNLFHSFREFNVGEGRGVYFANPKGIENILSRVTGQNSSQVLGRLGVLGQANLFFLNPNGIVFGPNSSLDISGSFHASTASGISLGKQGFFSAIKPEDSRLLSVNPGVFFFNQAAAEPGTILNQGTLSVGTRKSLRLVGETVRSTGSLKAPNGLVALLGNKVSLEKTAQVDVSSDREGGTVLVGSEAFGEDNALSTKRTFIGPNVAIDANAQLQGDGGNVFVWADEVAGFWGQVNARGGSISGNGGFVEVSGKEHVIFRGAIDTSTKNGTPGTFLLDPVNITIANGTGDGGGDGIDTFSGNDTNITGAVLSQPLGEFDDVTPITIYESELEGLAGNTNVNLQATNNIWLENLDDNTLLFTPGKGSIQMVADADQNGVGSFVMEDLSDFIKTSGRDISISGASLRLGSISTSLRDSVDKAGNIDLNAKIGDIHTQRLNTSSKLGNGGDVVVRAKGNVSTLRRLSTFSNGASGEGGDISIFSDTGAIRANGPLVSWSTDGGKGGDILLKAKGNITTNKKLNSSSEKPLNPSSVVTSRKGGSITISSESGNIQVRDSLLSVSRGNEGISGDIIISSTTGQIIINQALDAFNTGDSGKGGNITISAKGNILTKGDVSSFGLGDLVDAGYIKITSSEGNIIIAGNLQSYAIGDVSTFDFLDPENNPGEAGKISLYGNKIRNFKNTIPQLSAFSTDEAGDFQERSDNKLGGDVEITANNISGLEIRTSSNRGKSGNVTISNLNKNFVAHNLNIITSAPLTFDSPFEQGDPTFDIDFENSRAGETTITSSKNLTLDKVEIFASSNNSSNAGNIFIEGGNTVNLINNTQIKSEANDTGEAGNIIVTANQLDINSSSLIRTSTSNVGNAGDITVDVRKNLTINGNGSGLFANTEEESAGKAGNIFIKPYPKSNPISVKLSDGAKIEVSSKGAGEGGRLKLIADQLTLNEQAEVTASSIGPENAGNIELNIAGLFSATNSDITTSAAQASGGDIEVTAADIRLNNSDIETNVASGKGGGGNILLTADSILAFGDSDIFADSRDGSGGNIELDTPIFLGEGFTLFPEEIDRDLLEENGLVNINATGAISTGNITTPDVSFIEESLTELPETLINTTDLIANSCIVRTNVKEGKFIITGPGGVQEHPGDIGVGSFPTGTVQSIPQQHSASKTDPTMPWKEEDPIIEPQGVYQLADGKIVMSRECS